MWQIVIVIVIVIKHLLPWQKVVNKSNVLWDSAPYKMNKGPLQFTCYTKYSLPAQHAG